MNLNINGINVNAKYNDHCINDVLLPLIDRLDTMQKEKNARIIIYLAAAPGCGKSTLASYLEYLSNNRIQALSMDGFHHTNIYLNNHFRSNGEPLYKHKGAIDTFDVESLIKHIKDIKENKDVPWPIYDRKIHDPIKDIIKVDKQIILIEGNYLLLNTKPWVELIKYADYSIFIKGQTIDLENRLIERKMLSGSKYDISLKHYHETDKPNIELVNNNSIKANLNLKLEINDGIVKLIDIG